MPWDRRQLRAALSRATWRAGRLVARAGGDRAEAARLMWARSRHDKALREDLVKSAIAILTGARRSDLSA